MLLALRFLFGIGMGGEWGIGASLAMEKIPAAKRLLVRPAAAGLPVRLPAGGDRLRRHRQEPRLALAVRARLDPGAAGAASDPVQLMSHGTQDQYPTS
jgi:hypothetical protein